MQIYYSMCLDCLLSASTRGLVKQISETVGLQVILANTRKRITVQLIFNFHKRSASTDLRSGGIGFTPASSTVFISECQSERISTVANIS